MEGENNEESNGNLLFNTRNNLKELGKCCRSTNLQPKSAEWREKKLFFTHLTHTHKHTPTLIHTHHPHNTHAHTPPTTHNHTHPPTQHTHAHRHTGIHTSRGRVNGTRGQSRLRPFSEKI